MRTVAVILVIAAACATTAWGQTGSTPPELGKPINLDQALEIAFRMSPEIRTALDQLSKARSVVQESRANFNPRFSAEVVHKQQGPPVTISGIPGVGTTSVVPAQETSAAGSIFLPLDTNKKLAYISDISKLQFEVDYLSLTRTAEQLIYDVKKSYFNLLRAAGLEEVAQAAVDVAVERLKDANARYKAGSAPKFDVTRAEVEVANLNQRLIVTKNGTAISRAAFNRAMGIDVNTPTAIVKTDVPVRQDIKLDIPAKTDEAYVRRPEVKQAQMAIAIGRKNVKLQRSDLFPSMDIAGTYNYLVNPSGFSTANNSWIALLTLSIPVWNGGITTAKVQQAQADLRKSIDSLDQVKLGVALEVRTAVLNLQEAMERVSTTAEGVTLAEESLRLATVRYNAGYSPLVEVSDAESALTEARFNYVQAQYDTAISQAELERATATQPEIEKLQLVQSAGAS